MMNEHGTKAGHSTKTGQLGVPGDIVIFPGQTLENRDCPGKTGTDGHLTFNDFEIAGQIFLQVLGTTLGKRFAPNSANIYLIKFDKAAVVSDFIIKPQHYFRFIDDTFFIWCGSLYELKEFEVSLNDLIPGIKVTLVIRSQVAEFLDILVYKQWMVSQTVLKTRVFFEPTDTHQLLHGLSFHPKRGVLKSQFIRFKRICSSFREYNLACFT
jgi:hypothetical protein